MLRYISVDVHTQQAKPDTMFSNDCVTVQRQLSTHVHSRLFSSQHTQMGVDEGAPVDKFGLAYGIAFLQGMGMLFPWNVFITAQTYFHNRFCGSAYESNFENYFGVFYNVSGILTLLCLLKVQHKIPARLRVVGPLVGNFVAFLAVAMMVLIPPSKLGADLLFVITMSLVVFSGCCVAILQGGMFGLVGRLPPMYVQAVMGGQGLAGLVVSIVGLVTAFFAPTGDVCKQEYTDLKPSAFVYFAVSCVMLLACVAGYLVWEKLPFVRYYIDKAAVQSSDTVQGMQQPESYSNDPDSPLLRGPETRPGVLSTLKKVSFLGLCIFMTFFVTLSVFPSVTSHVISTSSNKASGFFSDTIFIAVSFVSFNLFDTIGRLSAGFFNVAKGTGKKLFLLSLLRIAWIPLFVLCHTNDDNANQVFTSDVFPMVFMALFALSNGLWSSMAFMCGPCEAPEAIDTAGSLLVLSLNCGLASGSAFSFVLVPFLK